MQNFNLVVEKFDEWQAICQSSPFQSFPVVFSYEGYNQFIKVLLVKVSDMLDLSNFFTVKVLRYICSSAQIFDLLYAHVKDWCLKFEYIHLQLHASSILLW